MSTESSGLDLNHLNTRSRLEKFRILLFGVLLQVLVDIASLPLILAYDKNRIRTNIDTGSTGQCRICIYIPRNQESKCRRGVIMHLHGGGWSIGRPETEAPICRYLADKVGTIVVSPDYRKAPQYPFPYALEQIFQVASWIARGNLNTLLHKYQKPNASLIQIDSSRIGISGGSAGSNLTCALSTLCVSRALPNEAKIVAQCLLYPVLNIAVPYEEKLARVDPARVLPQWLSRFFLKAYLPPPRDVSNPLVSPALATDETISKLPPTTILTAAYDYLAHEADEYANHLRSVGIPVRHRRFEDVGHGFDGIPTRDQNQRILNEKAREEAWDMIATAMRETLL